MLGWYALHGNALLESILAYTGTGRGCDVSRSMEPTAPPPVPRILPAYLLPQRLRCDVLRALTRVRAIHDLPTRPRAQQRPEAGNNLHPNEPPT